MRLLSTIGLLAALALPATAQKTAVKKQSPKAKTEHVKKLNYNEGRFVRRYLDSLPIYQKYKELFDNGQEVKVDGITYRFIESLDDYGNRTAKVEGYPDNQEKPTLTYGASGFDFKQYLLEGEKHLGDGWVTLFKGLKIEEHKIKPEESN